MNLKPSTLRGYRYTVTTKQIDNASTNIKLYTVAPENVNDPSVLPSIIIGNVALPFGINDIYVQYVSDLQPLRLPQLGTYGVTGTLNNDRLIIINTVYTPEFLFTELPCLFEHDISNNKQYLLFDLPSLILLAQTFPIVPVYSVEIAKTLRDILLLQEIDLGALEKTNVFDAGKLAEVFVLIAGIQIDLLNTAAGSYRVLLQLIPVNMYVSLYDELIDINYYDELDKKTSMKTLFYENKFAINSVLKQRANITKNFDKTSLEQISFKINSRYFLNVLLSTFVLNFLPLLGTEIRNYDLSSLTSEQIKQFVGELSKYINSNDLFNEQTRSILNDYIDAITRITEQLENTQYQQSIEYDNHAILSVNINVEYYNMFLRQRLEDLMLPFMQYIGSAGFNGTISILFKLDSQLYESVIEFVNAVFALKDIADSIARKFSHITLALPIQITMPINLFGVHNIFVRSIQLKSVEDLQNTYVLTLEYYLTDPLLFKEFLAKVDKEDLVGSVSLTDISSVLSLINNNKANIYNAILNNVKTTNIGSKPETIYQQLAEIEQNSLYTGLIKQIDSTVEVQKQLLQKIMKNNKLVKLKTLQLTDLLRNYIVQLLLTDSVFLQTLYFSILLYIALYALYVKTASNKQLSNSIKLPAGFYNVGNIAESFLNTVRDDISKEAIEIYLTLISSTQPKLLTLQLYKLKLYTELLQALSAYISLFGNTNILSTAVKQTTLVKYHVGLIGTSGYNVRTLYDNGILALWLFKEKNITNKLFIAPNDTGANSGQQVLSTTNDLLLTELSNILAADFLALYTALANNGINEIANKLNMLAKDSRRLFGTVLLFLMPVIRIRTLSNEYIKLMTQMVKVVSANSFVLPIDISPILRIANLPLILINTVSKLINSLNYNAIQDVSTLASLLISGGVIANGRNTIVRTNHKDVIRLLSSVMQNETRLSKIAEHPLSNVLETIAYVLFGGKCDDDKCDVAKQYLIEFISTYISILKLLGSYDALKIKSVLSHLTEFSTVMSHNIVQVIHAYYYVHKLLVTNVLSFVFEAATFENVKISVCQHSSISYKLYGLPIIDFDRFYVPVFALQDSLFASLIRQWLRKFGNAIYLSGVYNALIRYYDKLTYYKQLPNEVKQNIEKTRTDYSNIANAGYKKPKALVESEYQNAVIMSIQELKDKTGVVLNDFSKALTNSNYISSRKQSNVPFKHPSEVFAKSFCIILAGIDIDVSKLVTPSGLGDKNAETVKKTILQVTTDGKLAAEKLLNNNLSLLQLTKILTLADLATFQLNTILTTLNKQLSDDQTFSLNTTINNTVFMLPQDSGIYSNTMSNMIRNVAELEG